VNVKLSAKEISMSESTVLYEERGAVALVTLNRPQALNSLTHSMHQDLWAQLDKAEANHVIRAMVITGAGRGFCAGADLSGFDFSDGPDRIQRADPGPVIERSFNPTTHAGDCRGEWRGSGRGRFAGHGL
jgi:2-(1,2-epoxy-1,2-dihydrophenyl)acetyl-CoA isomerase